jgi:toxin CptA
MKSAPVITFDYRVSRLLLAAIVVALSLAMVALASCGLTFGAKLFCAALVVTYTAFAMRRFLRSAPRNAAWHATGLWRLVRANGDDIGAELRGSAIRGAWIVLNLRQSNGRRLDLILAPDNSDADTRRLLRVRLSRHSEMSRA